MPSSHIIQIFDNFYFFHDFSMVVWSYYQLTCIRWLIKTSCANLKENSFLKVKLEFATVVDLENAFNRPYMSFRDIICIIFIYPLPTPITVCPGSSDPT